MKVYQERWLQRLYNAKRRRQVVAVCKQINADDTGGTDALTQVIAREYLNLEVKYEAIRKKLEPPVNNDLGISASDCVDYL